MAEFSTDSVHGHDFYDVTTGAFKVPLYLSTIFEHPDRRTGETRKSDRGFEQKYSARRTRPSEPSRESSRNLRMVRSHLPSAAGWQALPRYTSHHSVRETT